jgi:hypothetical protein
MLPAYKLKNTYITRIQNTLYNYSAGTTMCSNFA